MYGRSTEDLRGCSATFRRVAGGAAGSGDPGPTSTSRKQRLVAGMGGNEGGERKIGVGRAMFEWIVTMWHSDRAMRGIGSLMFELEPPMFELTVPMLHSSRAMRGMRLSMLGVWWPMFEVGSAMFEIGWPMLEVGSLILGPRRLIPGFFWPRIRRTARIGKHTGADSLPQITRMGTDGEWDDIEIGVICGIRGFVRRVWDHAQTSRSGFYRRQQRERRTGSILCHRSHGWARMGKGSNPCSSVKSVGQVRLIRVFRGKRFWPRITRMGTDSEGAEGFDPCDR